MVQSPIDTLINFEVQCQLVLAVSSGFFLLINFRGEPIGDCGGCQVMSNPLILHGTQISLPKPRPPLPRIPECLHEPATQQTGPQAAAQLDPSPSQGGLLSSQQAPSQTLLPVPHPPFRSASNSSMFQATASQPVKPSGRGTRDSEDTKDRTLNADERLQRLKLRVQSTIEAYSGKASNAANAGKYSRSQSMTAASPHAAYHRTNSSPTRPSRVSLYGSSRRAAEESSNHHSSSSCSSAASRPSLEASAKEGEGACAPDDRDLLQARSMGTKRGVPQVPPCCCTHTTAIHTRRCSSMLHYTAWRHPFGIIHVIILTQVYAPPSKSMRFRRLAPLFCV